MQTDPSVPLHLAHHPPWPPKAQSDSHILHDTAMSPGQPVTVPCGLLAHTRARRRCFWPRRGTWDTTEPPSWNKH